eukprot:scaffold18324_cov176-Amphora_coffeaeformis.AAC.9
MNEPPIAEPRRANPENWLRCRRRVSNKERLFRVQSKVVPRVDRWNPHILTLLENDHRAREEPLHLAPEIIQERSSRNNDDEGKTHLSLSSRSYRSLSLDNCHAAKNIACVCVSSLDAALTPIGPLCSFRSPAATSLEGGMEDLSELGPKLSTAMTRVQLEMHTSSTPDKTTLLEAADSIGQAVDQWEGLVTQARFSIDFQSREYAKFLQAHLDECGQDYEQVSAGLRWQAACCRAVANEEIPPLPPPNLDLEKMMSTDNSKVPSMSAMSERLQIDASPFSSTETAFESPTVKSEFNQLCTDHRNLIEIGKNYGQFDPLGKLAFLDEMEKVEERWQIFFARFKLLDALDKTYVKQCEAFLASMSLTKKDFARLLQKAHQVMRNDAEKERDQVGL